MKLVGCVIVLLVVGTACTEIACGCTPRLNQAIVWGQEGANLGRRVGGYVAQHLFQPLG